MVSTIAFTFGFVGTATYNFVVPPRTDPFTGTEARQMREDLMKDIRALKQTLDLHIEENYKKHLEGHK